MRTIVDALLGLVLVFVVGAGTALAQETPFDGVACIMTAPPGQIPEAQIYAVDSEAEVWAMFCGGTAGYVSDLSLASPGVQYIGTGNVTPSGSVVDLGVIVAGSELIFMIYVRNTGYTYYSGPGSRNPDGQVHAAVTDLGAGYWLIGFEDLYGGGDMDYDDINVMLFAEVVVQPPCAQAGGDADGDGICGDVDRCPGTVLPDEVPTSRLGTNRFAADGDGVFVTTAPNGRGPRKSYTVASTGGCSCAQIIVALQLGEGHVKYGCSISAMDDWIALGSGGGQLE